MMKPQKSSLVVAAIGLHGLLSLLDIVFGLPALMGGVDPEGPPMFIIVVSLVIGLLGLPAAWGAWKGARWGMVSIIVLRLIDALGAAPGAAFAPTVALQIASVVGVVLSIAVIVLLLLPASRRAFA